MKRHLALALVFLAAPASAADIDATGRITRVESIKVDDDSKAGAGATAGAVAGGFVGSQFGYGFGAGSTLGIVTGAAVGAATSNAVQSQTAKRDAQRVSVQLATGGAVTVVQPVDTRLSSGMEVRVEGSGESARVVPR